MDSKNTQTADLTFPLEIATSNLTLEEIGFIVIAAALSVTNNDTLTRTELLNRLAGKRECSIGDNLMMRGILRMVETSEDKTKLIFDFRNVI